MSSITSGIGVSSGLDIASLIEQMLMLEARRAVPIQSRIERFESARSSLQQSRSLLLSLRSAATALSSPETIAARLISSSNSSVVGASVGSGSPAIGSLSLLVRSIATASHLVSNELASSTNALGAESMTLRFGAGRLVDDRSLAELRGGAGIARGRIRITDRAGHTEVIDLRHALSIDEVLDAINTADSLDVEAHLSADGRAIDLIDTGAGAGSIKVQEWGGGTTAASLGILGSSSGSVLAGETIAFLDTSTPLESIGCGVPVADGVPSFMISIDGNEIAVNLGAGGGGSPPRVATLGELIDRINAAIADAGFGSVASVAIDPGGDRLVASYTGAGSFSFTVPGADTDGGAPALATLQALGLADLEIDRNAPIATTSARGARILFGMHDVALAALDGGAGLDLEGSLTLIDRSGRVLSIGDFAGVDSIESLLQRLRDRAGAAGMNLAIDLDSSSTRIRIRDLAGGAGSLSASGAVAGQLGMDELASGALQSRDLRRADIGLGSSLDRITGAPVNGAFTITTRSGESATIAVSEGMTLLDLSRAVAASGLPVAVQVNAWGDAVEVVDHSSGPVQLEIADASNGAASALRIAGTSTDGRIDGTRTRHLQLDGSESAASLASMLDAIDGVDASIAIDDEGAVRLTVRSVATGLRNDLSLSIDGADLGLTAAVRGRDARILLSPDDGDGTLVTSATNRLTDLLDGAILELKSASNDVVTVTVSPSNQPIVQAVSNFVSALRSAISQLRSATAVDPESKTRGPLYGDAAATRARDALRSLVGSNFGPDGRRLARLGISVAGDGTVTFDETKLQDALASDPDGVRAQLAETDGVSQRFDAALGTFVDPEVGAIENDDSRLARIIDAANATIDRINDGLVRRRAVLLARFTAMEMAIERLRAQQSTMLSLLGSATGSSA